MMNVEERKALYALFAQLFSYPDQELVETLAAPETDALLSLLGAEKGLPSKPEAPLVRELQIAYTSLFINRIGGVPAPPYGSVYLEAESRLMGETTMQVAAWYKQLGLSHDGEGEPVDYLPTELEFLFFLVEREEVALDRGETNAIHEAFADQACFAEELFFPWVATFCQKVISEAGTHSVYRQAAELLARFCAEEQERLNIFSKENKPSPRREIVQ